MVMNLFCKSLLTIRYACRSYSQCSSYQVEQLHKRALIRLSGSEIYTFLQGLVTNDMNLLKDDGNALSTLFLNNKGRVMYDSLIYRKTDQELYLECDSSIRDNLIKHLKMYRVRKKIDIGPVEENVWVVFNENDLINDPLNFTIKKADNFTVCNAPTLKGNSEYEKFVQNIQHDFTTFTDPRIYLLGLRIYGSNLDTITKSFSNQGIDVTVSNDYTKFRYKLGVAEGVTELPPGNCFPLEANYDYIHGVSFHKGCYVGQELTARTHHTGVVRKRLMPLILSSVPEHELIQDSIIETEDGKKIGKLRGISDKYAIALLRITESLQNANKLKLSNVSAFTYKPYWWPQEHIVQVEFSNIQIMEAANHIAKDIFQCTICSLKEPYHYFGRQPPFNNRIKFKEDCYIMRDPFSPPNKYQFLMLGSKCSMCTSNVCPDPECSIYFTRRFCTKCVRENLVAFPPQIQAKYSKLQSNDEM